MQTKRIAAYSLGIGITIAATTAFADPVTPPLDYQPQQGWGQYGDQQYRRTEGWVDRYDRNGDQSVSFGEYRRFEIMSCERAFQRFDQNNDGVLTEQERDAARGSECDAIAVEIRSPQRSRWGWGRADYRRGNWRRGVSWHQFRSIAINMIERDFQTADRDNSGVLSRWELVSFKRQENGTWRDRPSYPRYGT